MRRSCGSVQASLDCHGGACNSDYPHNLMFQLQQIAHFHRCCEGKAGVTRADVRGERERRCALDFVVIVEAVGSGNYPSGVDQIYERN